MTTARIVSGTGGCMVYGYPFTGGALVKEHPELVDMLSYRSPAPMYRKVHPVPTKKPDSVFSCDALVRCFNRVRRN
ncbi:uncharacterized protein N7500_000295 [Penicillium coprophilum]|uniref:uncharacterized protein n=1 Tax=Penicillium coprophilum TaxID=36646 RepID=UPI0023979412|nr:uncharacterized protein N7500_000295 [Penicillium coprophilum]KAJ5177596.1 hypothetical protein N7500_000295 [Penicillium coprophilum]